MLWSISNFSCVNCMILHIVLTIISQNDVGYNCAPCHTNYIYTIHFVYCYRNFVSQYTLLYSVIWYIAYCFITTRQAKYYSVIPKYCWIVSWNKATLLDDWANVIEHCIICLRPAASCNNQMFYNNHPITNNNSVISLWHAL